MTSEKELYGQAQLLLDNFRHQSLTLISAESCTGGLIIAYLTEISGSSDVIEGGFVTYSNAAKSSMLGIDEQVIAEHGAVSEQVARAMAEGALNRSVADVAIATTGVAGPSGGSAEKPVGLVHFAVARRGTATLHSEKHFGDIGRHNVRLESVATAFDLAQQIAAG